MSQVVTEMQDTLRSDSRMHEESSEFDYQPVPPLAPISLFLGVCAVAGLAVIPGLSIGVVGILTGIFCLWQIRRAEGELGGKLIAKLGVALSTIFLLSGISWHTYAYATEVPDGHERMSFAWLSKQPLQMVAGKVQVSEEVEALEGKPIFVKGYMFPTRQLTGINEFVLLKDTGQCCFGGNPSPTDMIIVKFKDGMTVNHKEQTLVSVAGVFHASKVTQSGELIAIYTLEGTHFK